MSTIDPTQDPRPARQYEIVCPFCGDDLTVETRHEIDVNIMPDTVSLVVRAIGALTHDCPDVKR